MKAGAALAVAFAGLALTACPREQTPPREDAAPAAEAALPATPTSIAPTPPSPPAPQEKAAPKPTGKGMRAPPPEPHPLLPPPPVDR